MAQETELIIKRRKGWNPLNLGELWQFRELMYFLAWRDIKIKYKQSLLGVGWVILRPVVTMIVFSLLFGRLGKFPSEGVPYPIFVFLGLLPWTYFSSSLGMSSASLVGGANLISKIYFPRLLIPLSSALSELLDLLASMAVLVLMMIYYRIIPQPGILLVPPLMFAIFITVLGPGILLSAINVKYHDVKYVVPFLVQLWMFMTPVIYPVNFIPEKYRLFMYLNPMAGPIEAFRACVLGHKPVNVEGLAISLCVSGVMFAIGLLYFKRVERTFADVI
jgi:lipopolysaccharide transport system permease protein